MIVFNEEDDKKTPAGPNTQPATDNAAEDIIDIPLANDNDMIPVVTPIRDTTQNIIKVVGVGGGGCNAVGNMYKEGMRSVTFAVCNTDSKSLNSNPVPTKVMLGEKGLGAGADPKEGRAQAENSIENIRKLFNDNTQMAFIAAAMGGGTGTGAGPLVAKVAKEKGLLTIGIVTLPFYFEKRPKIMKALRGLSEMRENVDALLVINNEQISKIFSNSHIPVNEAMKLADDVMSNAVKSISELITLDGKIQTDFNDVKTTMKNGGGCIMAIGRASGEHRVTQAMLNALNSPLLYGSDINKATRILLNIYTSEKNQLFVDELEEIDIFMDELDQNIEVIWGMATDDTLDEDAKITILATGFENSLPEMAKQADASGNMDEIISELYGSERRHNRLSGKEEPKINNDPPFTVEAAPEQEENAPALDKDDTEENHESVTSSSNVPPEDANTSGQTETNKKPSFMERVKSRLKDELLSMVNAEDLC